MANEYVIKKGLIIRPLEGFTNQIITVDSNGKVITNGVTIQTITGDIAQNTADIATLQSDISGNYATISYVDSVSGNLQTQIDNIVQEGTTVESSGGTIIVSNDGLLYNVEVSDYISRTEVSNASGNLQTQIYDVQTSVDTISAGLASVYQGTVVCDTTNDTYTVTHNSVNISNSLPQVTLESPNSDAILYVDTIINRTSTSFDVVLSGVPSELGYKIHWLIIDGNNVGGGGSGSGGTQITNNGTDISSMELSGGIPTSLVPDASGAYDLGSVTKPWKELYLIGNTIYMDGKAISVDGDRLTFDNNKTLAYTDEVSGSVYYLEGRIDDVSSLTTTLSANAGLESSQVVQFNHEFNVGDPVRRNIGYNGIFTTFDTHNVQGNYKLVVNENEPYSDVEGLGYKINAYGGNIAWNNSYGSGFATHTKTFRGKYGDMAARFQYTGGTNDRGLMGFIVAPKNDFRRARLITLDLYGNGRIFVRYYNDSLGIQTSSWRNQPNSKANGIDLKITTEVIDGTIRVHTAYKDIDTETWSSYGYNFDTQMADGDEYRIGMVFLGGSQSYGTTRYRITADVTDFNGSLATPIYNPVWVPAGGTNSKHYFAEGIVSKIVDQNVFNVATSGILKLDNFFSSGLTAYLDQDTEGRVTYTKPRQNPQALYTGIDDNSGKLLLETGVVGSNVDTDDSGNVTLIPETSASNLGTTMEPWDNLHINNIELSGQKLISGSEEIPTSQTTMTISDSDIKSTSRPILTVQVPNGATEFPNVFANNVQDGSFNVMLNPSITGSGYYLNWTII